MTEEKDPLRTIRSQFKSEEAYKHYIADIFNMHAYEVFGRMLGFLCEKSLLSQREIGKRAIQYRKILVKKRYLLAPRKTRDIDQSGISRVIHSQLDPSYGQIYIWFHVLRERFESKEYKDRCEAAYEPPFLFTQELEDDMYRLALCPLPREVVEAYERHNDIIY